MARGLILVVSWSGMDPATSGSAPEDTRIRAVPDAHGLYMIPANGGTQLSESFTEMLHALSWQFRSVQLLNAREQYQIQVPPF
ncbi:hypothetical protein PI124_g15762 [Phytophthora idaei]|nr:hypothetical protein PI124_g15762 [Phytophthora idaei]